MRRAWLALPLLLAGCAGPAEAPPAPRAAASSTALCREHGVLEAVCTQCNPKLVPVFQAKGDWCAEHGFPESFCPVCHPERGGRPAAEVVAAEDEPPADRLKVRLASPQMARVVGIDTEKARPLSGPDGFVVPARLSYDASRRAEVNARSAGVVRSVLVDLGSRVRRGDALVVLESAEVGADRSRLAAARAREDVARAALERERALHTEGITPKREVEEAESALAAASGEVQALEAAAGVVGGGSSSRYTLQAPLPGTVVRRLATVGRQVDSEEVLLEIADASVLWAEIDVPERHLLEVAVGSEVALSFDGLPGRSFAGTIDSIAPELDPRTRTAMARVRLANDDGALRANMYGWARIATRGASAGARVPLSSVQRASGLEVVFVRLTEALYETRRVETAARGDGWVEVTRGVVPGEDVVTVGSFLLKTETLKGSIGAGCCE